MKSISQFIRLGTMLCVFATTAGAKTLDDAATVYFESGEQIMKMINSDSVDVKEVEKLVLEMTKQSVFIAQAYGNKFSEGKQMLDIILGQAAKLSDNQVVGFGPMASLDFETIEGNWHDMGFVETTDVGIDMDDEDNEHFTDPAHVVIHPIMTYVAAVEGQKSGKDRRDDMKAELQEGIEQLELLLPSIK